MTAYKMAHVSVKTRALSSLQRLELRRRRRRIQAVGEGIRSAGILINGRMGEGRAYYVRDVVEK